MAGTGEEIEALPMLDALNRSEEVFSNGGKWAALAWDNSTSSHNTGRDTTAGWGPTDAWPTINGAYWTPASFSGSSAAAVTMPTSPGNAERYVALWLDLSSPASAKSGYQLRWTVVSGTTYKVQLLKFVSGSETVLASNASVTIPAGATLAISDTGGTIAAWQGNGSALTSLLSASDTTYSSGYAAIEGEGNISRSTNFKAGVIGQPPNTTLVSGPKGLVVPNVSFAFSSSETGGSLECALDEAAYAPCSSPKAYENLAEGAHTFKARAVNASGPDATPVERSFTVYKAAKAVNATVLDELLRSEVPLATPQWTKFGWGGEIGGVWNGGYKGYGSSGSSLAASYWNPNSFSDAAGTNITSATIGTGSPNANEYEALWLDVGSPGSTRNGYEARFGGVNGAQTNLTVELSEWVSGSRTVLAKTTGVSLPAGSIISITETPGGTLSVWGGTSAIAQIVTAQDSTYTSGYAGLEVQGGAGTIYNFRAGNIDTVAPNTTITSGPTGSVLPAAVSFAFSSSEAGSSFECSLDAAAYATCASPKSYSTTISQGAHGFRVRALDGAGNVDATPAERSFTVIKPPTVTTNAATSVGGSTATLNASVNPEASATTYQFEYGTTTAYGTKAPATAKEVGSGSTAVAVSEAIVGLAPGTTYHFRITATNATGTSYGQDRTFLTPTVPTATTNAAANIMGHSATLRAIVNPGGAETTYQFEYGATTSYGSKAPATAKIAGSGSGPVEISQEVQGLTEGVTYHYRVVATNEVGTARGSDMTLATPLLPEVNTETAVGVEGEEAVLNGSVDPNGTSTEYSFEYGPTSAYGTTIAPDGAGDGGSAVEAVEAIGGLQPETTYHYRIVGTSQAGADYGQDRMFTTAAASGTSSTPIPGNFFGTQWTGDLGQTDYPNILSAVKNSGARFMRLALYRGANLESKYEEIFRYASHRGITVLPYIGDGKWPTSQAVQEEWQSFAKRMVEKYGPGGSFWGGGGHPVVAWEIWNEPNLPTNSPCPNPSNPKTNPNAPYEKICAEQFGNFFHIMAEGLKAGANGRDIEILTPGLFSFGASNCDTGECHLSPANFLGRMGHSDDYQAVSLHPYVFKVEGGSGTPHAPTGANQVGEVKEKVENYVRDVHSKLVGMGTGGKKIWVTELGFPVATNNPDGFPKVTEAIQREEIESIFGMLKSKHDELHLAHAFYYNIQDYRCSQWGHEISGCAVNSENPEWAYHTGLRKGAGGNRPAWKGFTAVTPQGHPNWSSPKKAMNARTSSRRALSAASTYSVETQGARYESRLEWGEGPLSSSYPRSTTWQPVEAQDEGEADGEPVNVEASTTLGELLPERVYHYRVAVRDEDGDLEPETSGHQFETAPLVTASVRTLNGEPGWVNVTGHVDSRTPINNAYVNINFKKKEGGVYVFKPEESTHATLTNSDFSLINWQIGRGEWQVNVVFEGNGETPRGETGLESFTVKNAYHLVASNSGKCLEVSYASPSDGMSIHQEPCGDGHTQQAQAFTLVPSPSNPIQYEIVNRNSGKCLDVQNVSSADGAMVQQFSCLGWSQRNQVFEGLPVTPSDPSHVKFVAQHSQKCLDITGGSVADGALLQQWSCTGAANQSFGFESVEADPVPTHAYVTPDETLNGHPGYETLHGSVEAPQSVAGQYVNVNFKKYNPSTGNYEFVDRIEPPPTLNSAGQWSFHYWGVSAGDWEVVAVYPGSGSLAESRTPEGAHRFHVGDGYRFQFRQSQQCVTTSGGGTGNGTPIIQWPCSGNPVPGDGQVYSVVPVAPAGSNNFQVRPDSNTGMCLDVAGGTGATQNGAVVQLWQCLGEAQTNQIWHIVELPSPNNGWFGFVANHSGRCMTVSENSTNNGARFLQWDCAWAGSQQWRWLPVG